jgi:hypothetical protein
VPITLTVSEEDLEEVALGAYELMVDVEWKCPTCGHVQTARGVGDPNFSIDSDVLRSRATSHCTNPGQVNVEPCNYSTDADCYAPPMLVARQDLQFRCFPLADQSLMAELARRGSHSDRGIRIVHSDLLQRRSLLVSRPPGIMADG